MGYYEPEPVPNRPHMHPSFPVGLAAGIIAIFAHLILLLINHGTNEGDLLMLLLIQPLIYFFGGQSAAERQYQYNINDQQIELTEHVRGAGTGAAIVASLIVWVFIILRGVFRDAFGITIMVNPLELFFAILIDVLVAMGLGTLAGRNVAKKYEGYQNPY